MTPEQQAFIEQAGLTFEIRGFTRMAGRALGWLMICQPPQQTMSEITEALGASKGAVSIALRELGQYGLVEKTSLPGVRADYHEMSGQFFTRTMEGGQAQILGLLKLAEAALEVTEGLPADDRVRAEDMYSLYSFMAEVFPKMLAEWQARRRQERIDHNG